MSKVDYSQCKTVFPKVLVRRKQNTEELATPGSLIWTPGVKMCDERLVEVLAVFDPVKNVHVDGTVTYRECEVKPGDTVWVYNFDGDNLNDMDDSHVEEVLEDNIHCIIKRVVADE